jgi:hypothetical protein
VLGAIVISVRPLWSKVEEQKHVDMEDHTQFRPDVVAVDVVETAQKLTVVDMAEQGEPVDIQEPVEVAAIKIVFLVLAVQVEVVVVAE